MDETRRRIVGAALKLHQSRGPAHTTIADVAREARVQRLTVYRHFPKVADLFAACRAQTERTLVVPNVAAWRAIADPEARLQRGLGELYAFYRRGQAAATNILRDAPLLPPRLRVGSIFFELAERAAESAAAGWAAPPRDALVRAAIAHAVDFWTWRSLAVGQGLRDDQAAELMLGMVRHAARPQARASG